MKALLHVCVLCGAALLFVAGCTEGPADPPPTGRGTVRGTVTDANGTAISGAQVQLGTATVSPTTTKSDGTYSFTGLKIGVNFRVSATHYSAADGLLTGISNPFTLDPAHTTKTVNLKLEGGGPPGPPPI